MSLFSYHALLVVESVTYHRPRSIDLGSYSRRVSSTVSAELADPAPPEPWTSPGAAAQRPPRLLLPRLGDYWWQRTEPLPSAAIVALLSEFGVSDSAARAALSRLTRNGLLVTSKTGRRTFSRLSSPGGRVPPAAPQRPPVHVQARPPHVLPAELAGGRDPGRRRAADFLLRRGQPAVGRHVVAGRVLHPRGQPGGPRRAA